jgi:hypothetical protein
MLVLKDPTEINGPEPSTATPSMLVPVVEPFMSAGVVQVEPSALVAYKGKVPDPTATHSPDELTVTDLISATAVDPFMAAGVVQVEPLVDVAYRPAELAPPIPTATNRPDVLTAMPRIIA